MPANLVGDPRRVYADLWYRPCTLVFYSFLYKYKNVVLIFISSIFLEISWFCTYISNNKKKLLYKNKCNCLSNDTEYSIDTHAFSFFHFHEQFYKGLSTDFCYCLGKFAAHGHGWLDDAVSIRGLLGC